MKKALIIQGLFILCLILIIVVPIFAAEKVSDTAQSDKTASEDALNEYLKLKEFDRQVKNYPENVRNMLLEGINNYINRHNDFSLMQKSIDIFTKVIKLDPKNEVAYNMLATVLYWAGMYEKDEKEKLKLFQKGKEYALKLVELNPDEPGGHFWVFSNLGMIGKIKGLLASMASIPTLKREIAKCLEINPDYAEAYTSQGMMFHELPGYLGGGMEKAINSYKKGIEIDPRYTKVYLEMARSYIEMKKYDEAKKTLEKLINFKDPKYPADYLTYDLPEGKILLEKVKKLK